MWQGAPTLLFSKRLRARKIFKNVFHEMILCFAWVKYNPEKLLATKSVWQVKYTFILLLTTIKYFLSPVCRKLWAKEGSHGELVCVCVVCSDSRKRPRLLDCRERRSSVERWIPEAELVLRFRLTWGLRSDRAAAEEVTTKSTEEAIFMREGETGGDQLGRKQRKR